MSVMPGSRLPEGTLREASVDVAAIAANVQHLRRMTNSEVIAVVKADGGLGVADVKDEEHFLRILCDQMAPGVTARPTRAPLDG